MLAQGDLVRFNKDLEKHWKTLSKEQVTASCPVEALVSAIRLLDQADVPLVGRVVYHQGYFISCHVIQGGSKRSAIYALDDLQTMLASIGNMKTS